MKLIHTRTGPKVIAMEDEELTKSKLPMSPIGTAFQTKHNPYMKGAVSTVHPFNNSTLFILAFRRVIF